MKDGPNLHHLHQEACGVGLIEGRKRNNDDAFVASTGPECMTRTMILGFLFLFGLPIYLLFFFPPCFAYRLNKRNLLLVRWSLWLVSASAAGGVQKSALVRWSCC